MHLKTKDQRLLSRRSFFKDFIAVNTFLMVPYQQAIATSPNPEASSPLVLLIDKNYIPLTTNDHLELVKKATLEFIETQYHGKTLPLWKKKFEEVDLEQRIHWLLYWGMVAIKAYHQKSYPVDSVWLMAQVMVESFFNELTVSSAQAVGPCQFINATANGYGLLCAGDKKEHFSPPYKAHELAGSLKERKTIRKNKRKFIKSTKTNHKITLDQALERLAAKDTSFAQKAQEQLQYDNEIDDFNAQAKAKRNNYKTYLLANFYGRDIFKEQDNNFLMGFDERVIPKRAMPAMVKMLAWALSKRRGNILVAASAYNAGLRRTIDYGHYRHYGRIPNINETATYVSRILVNYMEISKRL